jgi:hypothetical protein
MIRGSDTELTMLLYVSTNQCCRTLLEATIRALLILVTLPHHRIQQETGWVTEANPYKCMELNLCGPTRSQALY